MAGGSSLRYGSKVTQPYKKGEQMNLSQLSALGKVGGVPGIALGATVVVLGSVLGVTDIVPEAWRGPLVSAVALGSIVFCGLALAGWIRGSRGGEQIAKTDGS